MKVKHKADVKDKILKCLFEEQNKFANTTELAGNLHEDYFTILGLGEELSSEDFVSKINSSSKIIGRPEYIFKIRPKGVFFLNDEGGFIKVYNKQKRNKIWNWVKIIAGVLNAILIILISVWATITANDSNELRKTIIQKDSIIQNQMLKNNTLQKVIFKEK